MSVWRFSSLLPSVAPEFQVSLGEGDTPLVRSRSIGPNNGLQNLFFKLESGNPSGSYKDRFAALAISKMLELGQKTCLATSSGNTGAALAAYCAAGKIRCEIAVVEGAPDGKLRQMQAYGAEIYRVRGFGLDAEKTLDVMNALRKRSENGNEALQVSAYHFSPIGMAGVQSIAYELAEDDDFDNVFVPAGGGGLCLAVARGYEVLGQQSPKIECAQPEGNDTIASPLREGSDKARAVVCTSKISGLQVAGVIDGDALIAACRKSGGTGHIVTDEETWTAQKMMAREEGIFSEPAGAVALAAALKARREGYLQGDEKIVCLVTGSGFKDEVSLQKMVAAAPCPTVEAV